MLSERIRPGVESAPWVVSAIMQLEEELAAAYAEIRKQQPVTKAVFDRDVWVRAAKAGEAVTQAGAAVREKSQPDTERMNYVCSVTRCDPKMDGNHVYFGIGGRPIKGQTLRHAIDNEMVRMYGKPEMPRETD